MRIGLLLSVRVVWVIFVVVLTAGNLLLCLCVLHLCSYIQTSIGDVETCITDVRGRQVRLVEFVSVCMSLWVTACSESILGYTALRPRERNIFMQPGERYAHRNSRNLICMPWCSYVYWLLVGIVDTSTRMALLHDG